MISFAFVDNEGLPVRGGRDLEIPPGAVELSEPFSTLDLPRLVFLEGAWFERPSVQDFEETSAGILLPSGPVAISVEVTDLEAGTVTSTLVAPTGGALTLPTDGMFQIEVSAEPPWLPIARVITRGTGAASINAARMNHARANSIGKINNITGSFRALFSTDINGQSAIYLEKRAEAIAYLSVSPAPSNLGGYPFLAAELGVTAASAYELAQIWLNMSALFSQVGAATEKARMTAINIVNQAVDEDDLLQVEAGLRAQLTAILA